MPLSFPTIFLVTQVSASGTAVDFTTVPAGAKRVIVGLKGISTNGSSPILVQLGDSGGIENTGYGGAGVPFTSGATGTLNNFTNGIAATQVAAAGQTHDGQVIISLSEESTNTWQFSSVIWRNDGVLFLAGGSKALSAALDRVRLTMSNGTDTFDAGTVAIMYER